MCNGGARAASLKAFGATYLQRLTVAINRLKT
jgi:hypothetical protein